MTGFPIYDAHGTNVGTLTRNGSGGFNVGDRRTYEAWGLVRTQQSSGAPTLRYCGSLGHKADDESTLIYMRARYYEPTSGRFISEDPGQHGDNWYAYCGDDPVNRVDQSGKDWSDAKMAATFLLGCAMFFIGLTFIGVAMDLNVQNRLLAYDLSNLEKSLKYDLNPWINQMGAMKYAQKSEQMAANRAGSLLTTIVGYNLVWSGLLVDIDLAPDGKFDILQTFFGGGG